MQCDHGEIEVFLCPEDDSASSPVKAEGAGCSSDEATTETDTESEASPLKAGVAGSGVGAGGGTGRRRLPSPPPRLELSEEESRTSSSELGQIRNVLISASEDFGPMGNRLQLQTLDQEQSKY